MRQAPFILRAIAALLCLAYLLAGTQVLPAALTALAEFDVEHRLVVAHRAAGYELILVHDDAAPTPVPGQHRHDLGRWLSTLSALDGHGDHSCRLAILEAASGSDREEKTAEAVAQQTVFAAIEPLPWARSQDRRCAHARDGWRMAAQPRAALPCGGLDSVRMQV